MRKLTGILLSAALILTSAQLAHADGAEPPDVTVVNVEDGLKIEASNTQKSKKAKSTSTKPKAGATTSTHTTPQPPTLEELIAKSCLGDEKATAELGEQFDAAACPVLFGKSSSSPAITPQQVSTIAQQATLTLKLPSGKTIFYPEPHTNIHKTIATGYPLWIHTTDPAELTSTITQSGITITITAKRTHLVLNTGDKNIVRCETTNPFPANPKPMQPSPTCGHTYQAPNPAYQVTTTSHWTATWTALGQSGTVPLSQTHTQQLKVQDIVSVLTPTKP